MFEAEAKAVVEDAKAAVSLDIGRLGLEQLPAFDRSGVEKQLQSLMAPLIQEAAEKFEEDRHKAAMLKGAAAFSIVILVLWLAYQCCCAEDAGYKEAQD